MRITSPLLFAAATINGPSTTAMTSVAFDPGTQPPAGIMIVRVSLFAAQNQIASIQGITLQVGLFRDPDAPASGAIQPDVSALAATDLTELNTDLIALGSISYFATTGVPDVAVRPVQSISNPIATYDYSQSPPEARPITTRPMRVAAQQRLESGISAQTYGAGAHITYQTIELDRDELVGLVASR